MTIKDFKKALKAASDNATIEIVDGEIQIVEPKVEFKFKVGDKVKIANEPDLEYTIKSQIARDGSARYKIDDCWDEFTIAEEELVPLKIASNKSIDITDYILDLADASKWCCLNGGGHLVRQFEMISRQLVPENNINDILAYLKLRIITWALNEGWTPKFNNDERRWYAYFNTETEEVATECDSILCDYQKPASLVFKSEKLASHAAARFADIYADLCGGHKKR